MAAKKSTKPKLKVVDDSKALAVDISAEELVQINEGFQNQETKIGTLQGALRQEIGETWKEREVHPKAMSHMRTGMKIKDPRKRIDYFRSVVAVAEDLLEKYRSEETEEMDFDDDKKAAES